MEVKTTVHKVRRLNNREHDHLRRLLAESEAELSTYPGWTHFRLNFKDDSAANIKG